MNEKNRPIRVAQIVGKMIGGGVESVVMNYYRHIDKTKIQFDFIIDNDSTIVPEKEILDLGGRIYRVSPYQKPFKYHKDLVKLFKENNYKIVHSHINSLSVFPLLAAKMANVPIRIAHNHSTAGKGEFKKNLLKYSLRPFSKLFANTLCACSYHAGEWLFGKNTMRDKKVFIWKNGVDIGRYLFSKEIRDLKRHELGLQNKYVVAHVGRFMHQKNHEFIIDVFNEIYQKLPNSRLLLIGDGELMASIKRKVHKLGIEQAVIFTGNRTDVAKLYQAMDVFLLPSFYEGLGMVAIEAQISGLPVLCSDFVPIETKICGNIAYYSLDDTAEIWADEALKFKDNSTRESMHVLAENAGYEIEKSAKELTEWYMKKLRL